MTSRRAESGRRGTITVVLIIVLAIATLASIAVALRVQASPDAGQLPGPIPTWGSGPVSPPSSSAPSPTSTPAPGAASPTVAPQLLDMFNANVGVRAAAGSCEGGGTIQLTADGGQTWTTPDLGDVAVAGVLSVSYSSAEQIDVVVTTAGCTPTMLTSFTGGEYWEAYPERVAEASYVDPVDSTLVHSAGRALEVPCTAASVQRGQDDVVVLCADGRLLHLGASTVSWTAVTPESALAIGSDGSGTVLAAVRDPGCDGVAVSRIRSASEEADRMLACIAGLGTDGATLALDGQVAALWSSGRFLVSSDVGVTWAAKS